MQRDELVAIGELTGDALAGITDQVHGVHDAVARRVWASVGPFGTPVRLVHDAIAAGTYSAVEWSLGTAVRTGSRAIGTVVPHDSPSLEQSATGRIAIGVLNGAVGDSLERRGNALAFKMTVRSRERDVEPREAALRAEFPDATGRLVVFVHGLGETDDAWLLGHERNVPYGTRLRTELGYTPLYVRYNTGRPVSASGRELAELLHQLSREWPVDVEEIALIGHSVGGLVARSACEHADREGWRDRLTHVLTLGSPDRGAPLERAAHAVSAAMARLPETQMLGAALGRRSAGLKELRSGGRGVPFAADIDHYFVDYSRFGPLRHFQLLNDPAVYEQIRARLASRSALPAPRRGLPAPGSQRP
jgi:pimeloyl-ACP methyl ester carboxylesterase